MANMRELTEILSAVTKTTSEIQEMLKKSMPMTKDENQDSNQKEPEAEMGETTEKDENKTPVEEEPNSSEQEPLEVNEFAQEIGNMDDSELEQLLSALADELEKRQGTVSDTKEPETEAVLPSHASENPNPEMQAMKSENMAMRKSLQSIQEKMEKLEKSLSQPASRPAATNKPTVMQKSTKEPERLNKSEIVDYLFSLKKSGNVLIDTEMIWQANNVKTDEDIARFYTDTKIKGIELPVK